MERDSFASICWKEKRVIAISFFIALSQFQYGFDNAAVSGFQGMLGWLKVYGHVDPTSRIGYNIDTTVHTLIQSLLQLGGLVSCIFIFTFGASISRRLGIWTASVFGLVATAIQIGSTTLAALYIGRLLLGVSNGLFVTYSITYMSEIAPATIRGSIVGMVTLHTSFGALLGILIDNYTQVRLDRMSYQIPLIVMLVIPVVISLGLIFLDDTPRYYISRGQDDKAAASIRKMRGIKDESQIQADVAHIKAAWEAEREMYRESRLIEAFQGTYLRRTMICIGVSIGQTATGIIFISSFSVYFFIQADIGSPFKWVMYSLVIALFANFLSFPALRWINRRVLLVVGSFSSAALMFAIAAVYTVDQRGAAAASKSLVALSIVYTWVYGIAQGPTLWAIQAEVPPQRLRSQVVGLATGCNFIFAWLCAYCTPYFINPTALNWGPKYCYIWGGSNALLAIWVYFYVPETRGTTLEDLDELFESKISARKSARFRAMHHSDNYAESTAADVEKDRNVIKTVYSVDEMSQTKAAKE